MIEDRKKTTFIPEKYIRDLNFTRIYVRADL